jgi:NADH-quinone oxidoreductase subunit L
MLFGTDVMGHHRQLPFFLGAIEVDPSHDVIAQIAAEMWHGPVKFALHGFMAPAFWLALGGFALATFLYVFRPDLPGKIAHVLRWPVRVLERKYFMDDLWIDGFAGGGVALGQVSRAIDSHVIDGVAVNGSARLVGLVSGIVRRVQSGYLYHYAFAMIVGLIALLAVIIKLWA